ncbi:GbsR/MarR family transcriptional regulator [Natronospora cellulosivora (SeqCode)]
MDRTQEIERIREDIIELFGRAVGEYGMNETIGRIYGLLYFEEAPLSLQKIAENLAVSKATISNNIRILLELSMVKKSWRKGSRKDFYIAEKDFEKIIQHVLKTKEIHLAQLFKESLARTMEKYQSLANKTDDIQTREYIAKDIEKIEYLKQWIDKGESWLKFFLELNFSEEPTEEVKEIEIDWDE